MRTVEVTHKAGDTYTWKVVTGNYVDSQHRLKQAAERTARELAKDNRPSQLVVRKIDGEITYTQRYEA